jgi:hypothetical protein
MHNEKVSRMSHKGFFNHVRRRNLVFGNFSWMLIFENTSNATYLISFINN